MNLAHRTGASLVCAAGTVFSGACAMAQSTMYAFGANGSVYTLDLATGAAAFVGSSGFGANAAAADSQGRLFTMTTSTQLYQIDPVTGLASLYRTITGFPLGTSPRGIAFDSADRLYVAFSPADTQAPDTLGWINIETGACTIVGSMIRPDIQGLAFDANDRLFAVGVFLGGILYSVNTLTGAAAAIGGSGIGGDSQSLEFTPDGTLYGCRENLITIDPATGNATLVGPTGLADVRGLAFIGGAPTCYPDCDTSTGPGVLDIFDFLCFGNRFAAGDPYACDCDVSTGPLVCDIFDFLCFGNAFNAGCP